MCAVAVCKKKINYNITCRSTPRCVILRVYMVYNSLQCPICYEGMTVDACILECGHTFCKTCIDRARQYRNACPECRAPVMNGRCIRNGIVSDVDIHLKNLQKETQDRMQRQAQHIMQSCQEYVLRVRSDMTRQYTELLCCSRKGSNTKKRKWDMTIGSRSTDTSPSKKQKRI